MKTTKLACLESDVNSVFGRLTTVRHIWLLLYNNTFLLPGLRIRIFNLFIKLLSCVLYIVRASLDTPDTDTFWWE